MILLLNSMSDCRGLPISLTLNTYHVLNYFSPFNKSKFYLNTMKLNINYSYKKDLMKNTQKLTIAMFKIYSQNSDFCFGTRCFISILAEVFFFNRMTLEWILKALLNYTITGILCYCRLVKLQSFSVEWNSSCSLMTLASSQSLE